MGGHAAGRRCDPRRAVPRLLRGGPGISRPAVLLDVVQQLGLPVDDAREVLERRTFKVAVDADWALSREYGISGVPTFVAGGYGVVGAQPYEALEALVRRAASRGDAAG